MSTRIKWVNSICVTIASTFSIRSTWWVALIKGRINVSLIFRMTLTTTFTQIRLLGLSHMICSLEGNSIIRSRGTSRLRSVRDSIANIVLRIVMISKWRLVNSKSGYVHSAKMSVSALDVLEVTWLRNSKSCILRMEESFRLYIRNLLYFSIFWILLIIRVSLVNSIKCN